MLNNALLETGRLNKLVDNVLMANQIENNNLSLQNEKLNLSELIELTVHRYFSEGINNSEIRLNLDHNVYMEGDKELLPSVIINLIENAYKYSFDKVEIEVVLKKLDQGFLLKIMDKGFGIPDKDKEQVFLKFFRAVSLSVSKVPGIMIPIR